MIKSRWTPAGVAKSINHQLVPLLILYSLNKNPVKKFKRRHLHKKQPKVPFSRIMSLKRKYSCKQKLRLRASKKSFIHSLFVYSIYAILQ